MVSESALGFPIAHGYFAYTIVKVDPMRAFMKVCALVIPGEASPTKGLARPSIPSQAFPAPSQANGPEAAIFGGPKTFTKTCGSRSRRTEALEVASSRL